jgi:hypothetical protein
LAGVILLLACAFTWSRFVDWSGPADDLAADRREAIEGCLVAERALGDGIYRERPDCRAILEPARAFATVPVPGACVRRENDKLGGDDGLDTCGYPGFPKCLDALPPGCP